MGSININSLPPELILPVFLHLPLRADFVALALTSRFCYTVATSPTTFQRWFELYHKAPERPIGLSVEEMNILGHHFGDYRRICLWLARRDTYPSLPLIETTLSREVGIALTLVMHSREHLDDLTSLPPATLRKMFNLCAAWDPPYTDNTVLAHGGLASCFRPGRGRVRTVSPQDSGASHKILAFFDLELSRPSGKYVEGTTFPFLCLCGSGEFAGFDSDLFLVTGKMLFRMVPWEIRVNSEEHESMQEVSSAFGSTKIKEARWKKALTWVKRKLGGARRRANQPNRVIIGRGVNSYTK